MSRCGYVDHLDQWDLIRYRGAVASAIRGKRGQEFLRNLLDALDAMPNKRLVANDLQHEGEVCTLGCALAARSLDVEKFDGYEHDEIGAALNIANPLVAEIEWENDESPIYAETPEQRWERMRAWVAGKIA